MRDEKTVVGIGISSGFVLISAASEEGNRLTLSLQEESTD